MLCSWWRIAHGHCPQNWDNPWSQLPVWLKKLFCVIKGYLISFLLSNIIGYLRFCGLDVFLSIQFTHYRSMFLYVMIFLSFPLSGKLLHDGFWIFDRLNRLFSALFFCFGFCNLLLFSWKLFYAFNLSALAILFFCYSFAPSLGFLFGRSCFCNCFLYFLKIFTSEVIFFWKLLLCNCFLMENFTSVNIFFQKTFTFTGIFFFENFALAIDLLWNFLLSVIIKCFYFLPLHLIGALRIYLYIGITSL